MAVEITLGRIDRLYHSEEKVNGVVTVILSNFLTHYGVGADVWGKVSLQTSPKNVGVVEAFYGTTSAIIVFEKKLELASPGNMKRGKTEIPFEFILDKPEGPVGEFYDTFHGKCINIQYHVNVEIRRGILLKPMSSSMEFIVEGKESADHNSASQSNQINFSITPESQHHLIGLTLRSADFLITGALCSSCSITSPVCGELTVKKSSLLLKSIDFKLLRSETISDSNGNVTNATSEIQCTQIADGDVCRDSVLPIYVILPRLYTCPTTRTKAFSIEFEAKIVVTFSSNLSIVDSKDSSEGPTKWMAVQTIPLLITR